MIFKSTSIQNVSIDKAARFTLQVGTSNGSTSSNFPINVSDFDTNLPNAVSFPSAYRTGNSYPYLSQAFVWTDRSTYAILTLGDSSTASYLMDILKPGDMIQLSRYSLKRNFMIASVQNSPNVSYGHLSIVLSGSRNQSDSFSEFDHFVDSTGYPNIQDTCLISFTRRLEDNYLNESLSSFTVTFGQSMYSDSYSVTASWQTDPSVSATQLRWRSVPNNRPIGNLSFSLAGSGFFSKGPVPVTVISGVGSGSILELTGGVTGPVTVTNPGSGYTYANVSFLGSGFGASAIATVSGGKVTAVNLVAYGSGYDQVPQVQISGDGMYASAEISAFKVDTLNVLQTGAGYLTSMNSSMDIFQMNSLQTEVDIDFTNAMGSTSMQITPSISLQTEGRIDYVSVIQGGTGYTGANVYVTSNFPGGSTAYGYAEIANGSITNIVLTDPGYGFTQGTASFSEPNVFIVSGTGGTGAVLRANVDLASEWIYGIPQYGTNSLSIEGFKNGISYEIQILTSATPYFTGTNRYSDSLFFSYI